MNYVVIAATTFSECLPFKNWQAMKKGDNENIIEDNVSSLALRSI